MVGFFCFVFSFLFAGSSSIIAFVADTQLCRAAIRTNTPCGVREVACHVQMALLVSFLGLRGLSGVPIGALVVVLQQWLLVATSVEVFAVVPLGVSCFLSCWVGGTLWPVRTLGRRQVASSRHSATSGRRVMRARLVFWRSGPGGMNANAVDTKSAFLCFENKRAPVGGR